MSASNSLPSAAIEPSKETYSHIATQLTYRGPVRTECDDATWALLLNALVFMVPAIKNVAEINDAIAIEQSAELMLDCAAPLLALDGKRPVKETITEFCGAIGYELPDIWEEFQVAPQIYERAPEDFSRLLALAERHRWPAAREPVTVEEAEAIRLNSLKAPIFQLSPEEFRYRSDTDRIMVAALQTPAKDRVRQLIEVRDQIALTTPDEMMRKLFESFASFALCLIEPEFSGSGSSSMRRFREEVWRIWNGGDAPKDPDKLLRPKPDLDLLPPPVPTVETPSIDPVGEIPEAGSLCTDQMNAKRLECWYGKKLIACAGDFFGYDGKRWVRDQGFAARCAATLAQIVRAEAKGAREQFESLSQGNEHVQAVIETCRRDKTQAVDKLRATPSGVEIYDSLEKAEALEKWAVACEGATIQQKALGMLRSMHTVEASVFDRGPMLLNCANGTVDLRTGKLRPHDPHDFMTKLCPVNYDPAAKAPRWEKFISEILDPDVAAFMQRWYGYCATADVSEQVMLVKIGEGRNGKSTETDVISEVLGDYADTSAVGLLTATSDRHPTEVAALFGLRLVTTHESDESALLREGLIKQITGGDRINARHLYRDAFTFEPTFKLQLLSNHRPAVKGTDDGIWRRLRLVSYRNQFGTPEEVATGKATRVRDKDLKAKMLAEREGILTWIVTGAMDWATDGLREPPSVLVASESYRREQNRVGQWIKECCTLDPEAWSPYAAAPYSLYPSYTEWCKQSGLQPLSKLNFIDRLQQEVPDFRAHEMKQTANGTRKTVRGCFGLKVDGLRFGLVGGAS